MGKNILMPTMSEYRGERVRKWSTNRTIQWKKGSQSKRRPLEPEAPEGEMWKASRGHWILRECISKVREASGSTLRNKTVLSVSGMITTQCNTFHFKTEVAEWGDISSAQFSCSVMSDFLRPHESQHTRPPCPTPTPGVHPLNTHSLSDFSIVTDMCNYSVQFSRSVVSDSLRPHESQHATPPCRWPSPGVYSDSRSSSQWCHPAISSSVVPFSSCPQSLPASGFFQWVNSLHEVAKILEFHL